MENKYTPGCVSVVIVLAIGFFVGKINSGGGDQDVLSRIDQLSQEVNQIKTMLSSGVVMRSTEGGGGDGSAEADYGDTFDIQKQHAYTIPDWDQGADPSVPAELGGQGFTGDGWQSNFDHHYIGDPRAKKGGMLKVRWPDFPTTFRFYGAKANTSSNRSLQYIMSEPLFESDPLGDEAIPVLGTHWKVEDNYKTVYYRINPSARWSDGTPVTTKDIIETVRILRDPGIESPSVNEFFNSRIEKIEALSKYIVKVTHKKASWRNEFFIGAMYLMPGHVLENLDGAQYLKKFQFKFMPTTGPYEYDTHKAGSYLVIKRRKDYWGKKLKINIGRFNFDRVKFVVLRDFNTAYEAFKKGDIDLYRFFTSQRWVEQTNDELFVNGLIQKRKLFHKRPAGLYGHAFNLRKPPFNDRNVRLALSHLLDFDAMNEKLMFDEYMLSDSYFDNSDYERPNKKEIYTYNPEKAKEYLAKAGWINRNSDGYLEKDGQVFEFSMYINAGRSAKIETKYQEDLKKVGIKLNLIPKSSTEMWKLGNERKFEMYVINWVQYLEPTPEHAYHSRTADQPNTNNFPGVKDPRLDQLIEKIENEPTREGRKQYFHEIDRILYDEIVPVSLRWISPFHRFAYHNFFGYPSFYYGPYAFNDSRVLIRYWWYDEEKRKRYDTTMNQGGRLPVGDVKVRYWLDFFEN